MVKKNDFAKIHKLEKEMSADVLDDLDMLRDKLDNDGIYLGQEGWGEGSHVTCALCRVLLRKDKALLDAEWEEFNVKGKIVYVCRDCAKMVAQGVLDGY